MKTQTNRGEVTELLWQWAEGAGNAFEELIPLIYRELHQTAKHYFASDFHNQTLQPTALISETYLRLRDRTGLRFPNRSHFYAYAGQTMRHILLDYARKKSSGKRGGHRADLPLEQVEHIWNPESLADPDRLIALNNALDRLSTIAPRKALFLEQFYFAGLNAGEMAEVAHLTASTVRRELRAARHWLGYELAKK